jgi:hypothetical protein
MKIKNIFPSIILIVTCTCCAAQPKYLLSEKWADGSLNKVSDSLLNIIGDNYKLTVFNIRMPLTEAVYQYTDYKSNSDIYVSIKPEKDQIASVRLSGPYKEVFKVFQHMFAPNADMAAVEKLGKIPRFGIQNKKVRVIPQDSSSGIGEVAVRFQAAEGSSGTWELWIGEAL